jgi:sulfite reductase beta subunit-like hemoprotein
MVDSTGDAFGDNGRGIVFPCKALPDEPGEARLLGIYPQRQERLFMQRVKVPGGRLRPDQLRVLATLSLGYTRAAPLHLTTRQDVELHNLAAGDLPAVQKDLAAAGLTVVGACGDTVRNVTVCCGFEGERGTKSDLPGLAEEIRKTALQCGWMSRLPRKFKISFSACEKACGKPWINDLGFVAERDGSLLCVAGGSLGPRPATGIALERRFGQHEILPLVMGALALFDAEGDRRNRGRARLRHVRERLGDAEFVRRLLAEFEKNGRSGNQGDSRLSRDTSGADVIAHVQLPLGDIGPSAALALADSVEKSSGWLCIGLEHDLYVYGKGTLALEGELAGLAATPRVVACPGTTWCSRGITDSRGAAVAVREALAPGCELLIAISACPNNCSQAAVADIGLVGGIRTIGSARVECYRLFVGGDQGRGPGIGVELHAAVPAGKVGRAVAAIVKEHQTHCEDRKVSFAEFVGEEREKLSAIIGQMVSA